MEMPNIPHPIRDAERNITYVVMAYRALSKGEVVTAVRMHLAGAKRPKKNSKVVIFTVMGATDSL